MTSRLQAGAPTLVLMSALSRAGYGYLDGPELKSSRAVLHALARLLHPDSGSGKATAFDIAHAAGYKDRQTRYALNHLEGTGVITRERGYVGRAGRLPTWFRINKELLLEWILDGRPALEAARALHKKATDARLRGISFLRPRRQKRRSSHVALIANPSQRNYPAAEEPPGEVAKPVRGDALRANLEAVRAEIRRNR